MSITRYVSIPKELNAGVSPARQQTMLSLIGNPRAQYSSECQNPTNSRISAQIVTAKISRLKVTGLDRAVQSLNEVMSDIEKEVPKVFAVIGHAGMLCARFVRGSQIAISNHSWGTAIDLTLDGQLDRRGDGLVQEGLTLIAPIFNRHSWFWGAGFRTEDAMHFECSDELIRRWAAEGAFGAEIVKAARKSPILSLGDRGTDVMDLQKALNKHGALLLVDGEFGRNTLAAVMAFQAAQGLTPDGVIGEKTRKALFG